jgi:membrane protease subunit HflK
MPWDDQPNNDKKRKNPWGSGGNNRPPQGNQGGGQGGDRDRDRNQGQGRNDSNPQNEIYSILRKAQDGFRGGNGGGGYNGGGDFGDDREKIMRGVIIGLLALVVMWFLSGFYFVQPNENAVVVTFGKFDRTEEEPGLKYRLPSPFQSHQIVDVTTERRIEIGYREETRGRGDRNYSGNDVPDESLMLTGDENIIDVDFVVLWRVSDAKEYLYSIRNPEDTIKIVAESAMREIIGRTQIQPALTEARSQIQSDSKLLIQQILDEYKAGIAVNNIQLQKVDPPGSVIDAFNDVQRARQEKEQLRNQAEAYRNDIIPRARGESEKLRQAAEAYKAEVVSQATGDAARFKSVYEAYNAARDVTAERMYLETMEQVLKNAQTIVLDDKNGALPYLSLNELRGRGGAAAAGNAASTGASAP